MRLVTPKELLQLTINARASQRALDDRKPTPDHTPVVRLVAPALEAAWIASELHECRRLYGVTYFSTHAYLATFDLRELEALGSLVRRDPGFRPVGPLSHYAREARAAC
jgi:hypothetical protein